jgi:hypothetical protein
VAASGHSHGYIVVLSELIVVLRKVGVNMPSEGVPHQHSSGDPGALP